VEVEVEAEANLRVENMELLFIVL